MLVAVCRWRSRSYSPRALMGEEEEEEPTLAPPPAKRKLSGGRRIFENWREKRKYTRSSVRGSNSVCGSMITLAFM